MNSNLQSWPVFTGLVAAGAVCSFGWTYFCPDQLQSAWWLLAVLALLVSYLHPRLHAGLPWHVRQLRVVAAVFCVGFMSLVGIVAAGSNEVHRGFMLVVLTAIYAFPITMLSVPVAEVWRYFATPGAKPGHCRCGYNLAGLANGAACPECGGKS